MPGRRTEPLAARSVVRRLFAVAVAIASTLLLFLVLPLIQAIGQTEAADLELLALETTVLPPPPPPPTEEEPEEEPAEEPPPELIEDVEPLDLGQLELVLEPSFQSGLGGLISVDLGAITAGAEAVEALFSLADLDQKPRVIYQANPVITPELRKKAPGTAHVVFVVDKQGRVQDAVVQSSTDPVFERAALAAVKQWKFEPGTRSGEPVRFRMRVPIVFPQGA